MEGKGLNHFGQYRRKFNKVTWLTTCNNDRITIPASKLQVPSAKCTRVNLINPPYIDLSFSKPLSHVPTSKF
ncbi:hypothetical protein Ahy_B03g063760 isoform B [Arachis hypogaea]|uniref:Uncharacterized protein n=1 Tax=Arachis hypogaea TaxID=3818 RepID=A0A444ZY23_ARAHY|nr:hypothetical protein Ahy_B03g063760 isoform B [Arachis hypogaea]